MSSSNQKNTISRLKDFYKTCNKSTQEIQNRIFRIHKEMQGHCKTSKSHGKQQS